MPQPTKRPLGAPGVVPTVTDTYGEMVCVADELLSRLAEACAHLSGGFRAYLGSGKAPIITLVSSQAKNVVVHAEVCICPSSISLLGVVPTLSH